MQVRLSIKALTCASLVISLTSLLGIWIVSKCTCCSVVNILKYQTPVRTKDIDNDPAQDLIHIDESPPWIYAITPTYTRYQQKAELTRLSHMIAHLPNFHWIVVEDSQNRTDLVANFLHRSKLTYTHLNIPTPDSLIVKPGRPRNSKHRGTEQRNVGLKWLRLHQTRKPHPAVVYFMDDDNTYDLEIFHEMRKTQGVSIWPVGLACKLRYEAPICSANGKVTGWVTHWHRERPFCTDMAGFAVNFRVLLEHPGAEFNMYSPAGHMETDFLESITTMEQLEPFFNCTRVLAWHTRTETPDLSDEQKMWRDFGHGTDPNIEI